MRASFVAMVAVCLGVVGCVASSPTPPSDCASLKQELAVFRACGTSVGCLPTFLETLWLERKMIRCQAEAEEAGVAPPRS
jgi:hypothetical protein